MATKTTNKVIDFYLKFPIWTDGVVILIIWFLSNKISLFSFVFLDKNTLLNITSNVIGTCISLAGFILAALTIIVTFRSNLKAKGVDTANNAMELIITSGYYNQIVGVYTGAIYEFLIISFSLYCYWICVDNIINNIINTKIVFSGLFATATSVFRSLWVLFTILKLEKFERA